MTRRELIEKMRTLDYWLEKSQVEGLLEMRAVIVALAAIPVDDATHMIDDHVPGSLKDTFYRLVECENLHRLSKKQA